MQVTSCPFTGYQLTSCTDTSYKLSIYRLLAVQCTSCTFTFITITIIALQSNQEYKVKLY